MLLRAVGERDLPVVALAVELGRPWPRCPWLAVWTARTASDEEAAVAPVAANRAVPATAAAVVVTPAIVRFFMTIRLARRGKASL